MNDFETHPVGYLASLRDDIGRLEYEVRRLEDRVAELMDGSCRYNCRTVKEGYIAGYLADSQHGEHSRKGAERSFRAWMREENE